MAQDHSTIRGPVKIAAAFYLPRPRKPRSEEHQTLPTLRSLEDALLSGLRGIVYRDDAQIVRSTTYKYYAEGVPHVSVVVIG